MDEVYQRTLVCVPSTHGESGENPILRRRSVATSSSIHLYTSAFSSRVNSRISSLICATFISSTNVVRFNRSHAYSFGRVAGLFTSGHTPIVCLGIDRICRTFFTVALHIPKFDFLTDCNCPTPSNPGDIAYQFSVEPSVDFDFIVQAHLPDPLFYLCDAHNTLPESVTEYLPKRPTRQVLLTTTRRPELIRLHFA
jgi:hypothetical protein